MTLTKMTRNKNDSFDQFLDFILENNICPIHPNYLKNNKKNMIDAINNFFEKRNELNKNNKWGFNYHLREVLERFIKKEINLINSKDDIMNYIIYKFYNVKRNKENNLIFSVKNPQSIYEVIYLFSLNLKDDNRIFTDKVLLDNNLKKIDDNFKKQNNQYTFHSLDDSEIEILSSAIYKYLKN